MHEALFWKPRGESGVACELCPRACVLTEGQLGACGTRQARDGKLYAMTYAKPCAINVDPVEKKPLFHFRPGAPILSIATIGCNLFCDFCQNWEISKARFDGLEEQEEMAPGKVVEFAKRNGYRLIAFTYTEPTVYYEYMLDTAKTAYEKGLECVMVSNGYINPAPLAELIPYLAAANIDLKGTKEFYRKRCKVPDPARIKETIVALKKAGVHVEVTNLLIPGDNDSDEEVSRLASWVAEHVGRGTPLHFSAFHPDYRLLDKAPTATKALERAREIAREHLDYVYIGNAGGVDNDTRCPGCGETVIVRKAYVGVSRLKNGKCACGHRIPGVF